MSKKDRIAVVVSIIYFLLTFVFASKSVNPIPTMFLGFMVIAQTPSVLYWSYRFIKNDISFLKIKDE